MRCTSGPRPRLHQPHPRGWFGRYFLCWNVESGLPGSVTARESPYGAGTFKILLLEVLKEVDGRWGSKVAFLLLGVPVLLEVFKEVGGRCGSKVAFV